MRSFLEQLLSWIVFLLVVYWCFAYAWWAGVLAIAPALVLRLLILYAIDVWIRPRST